MEGKLMAWKKGAREARAEEYYRRYMPIVLRRARELLRNDADALDVAQDVFVKLMASHHGDELARDAAAFLHRVTTNACLNRSRNEGRRRASREREFAWRAEGAEPTAEGWLLVRELVAAADRRCAAAAICVHVEGMSRDEAADVLGVSERTVSNQLKRFQQKATDDAALQLDEPLEQEWT